MKRKLEDGDKRINIHEKVAMCGYVNLTTQRTEIH